MEELVVVLKIESIRMNNSFQISLRAGTFNNRNGVPSFDMQQIQNTNTFLIQRDALTENRCSSCEVKIEAIAIDKWIHSCNSLVVMETLRQTRHY